MNPLRLRLLAVALAFQRGLLGTEEATAEVRSLESGEAPTPPIPGRLAERMGAGPRESLERDLHALGADEAAAYRAMVDSFPSSSGWHRLWNPPIGDATVPAAALEATMKAASKSPPQPGTRSILPKERYAIRKELARGGMGRVLVAMDNLMGREVAIKEMIPLDDKGAPARQGTPGKSSGADFERFLREAKVTGQLEHPNIVPVYEIGQNPDGTVFYAMKYVRGRTFAERLWEIGRDVALKTAEDRLEARLSLLDAFVQVCQAVAYAHSRGVINRDLKPANLILGDFGETLVLDWGLARVAGQEDRAGRELMDATALMSAARAATQAAGGSSKLTVDGAVFGTPSYMPPEQARGRIDEVDEKSDVYALGAILYEIVTAHAPYEGPNVAAILQSVLTVDPVPVRVREPEAPKELAALVAKAMDRDRGKRLASAMDLAAEVKAYRDGKALASYRYSLAEQISRVLRKHRALAAATAAAFLILVAGVVVSLYYAGKAGNEATTAWLSERSATAARDKASARAESERIARLGTQKALVRAQGERLAAVAKPLASEFPATALLLSMRASEAAPGLTANNALYESLLHLSEMRHFYWHEIRGRDTAWSPDNRRLATCGDDYLVRLWDVTTGVELGKSDDHDGPVIGVAFSADGRRLLSWSSDGTARLWDGENLRPVVTLSGHTGEVRGARFSADGAAVLTWSADGTVRLWSLSTGKSTVFACDGSELSADLSADGSRVVAANAKGPAWLWNAADGSLLPRLAAEGPPVVVVRFSPDGHSVVTSGADGQLRTWDVATGAARGSWTSNRVWGARTDVRWSPDGKRIATAGIDGVLAFQDADTGANAVVFKGVYEMTWGINADWTRVAVSSGRHQVVILDGKDCRPLVTLGAHEYAIEGIRFSPDGQLVSSISRDRTAIVWHLRPGRETPLLESCAGSTMVSPCPDGRTALFRLDAEGHVGVRDLETGETLSRWEDTLEPWEDVVVDPQGKWVAVSRPKKKSAELRDLRSGRVVRQIDLEAGNRFPLCINVTGTYLTCIGDHKRIVVLALPGGDVIGDFSVPEQAYTADTSADGRTTFTTLPPAAVVIAWETATGKELGRFKGHSGWTLAVRALVDGKHIVTTAADASIRIWDTTTYHETAAAAWPRIEDTVPVPSPDGKWIGVFVNAGEVHLLRAEGMQEHLVLPFLGSPSPLGFTTDSTTWLAPYADGTLRRVPLDLLAAARRAVPREMLPSEMAHFDIGDPAERKACYDSFLRAHPSARAVLSDAGELLRAREFEAAVALGRTALALLPRHPMGHELFLEILVRAASGAEAGSEVRRSWTDEALREARRALELGVLPADIRDTLSLPATQGDSRFEALLKEFTK